MENKPVLKKIRRPINRTQPLGASYPAPSSTGEEAKVESNFAADKAKDQPNIFYEETSQTAYPVNLPSTERVALNDYNQNNYNNEPQYVEDEYPEEYFAAEPQGISVKLFILGFVIALIIGVLAGKYLLGENQVSHNGLQGVIANNEVPRGRARCGVADRTQGCVLYIMNPQRQNVKAKDFYDMAAQMTGRQRFMIETGNMRYANTEIRPGDIAQLNIPPL